MNITNMEVTEMVRTGNTTI